MESIDIDRANLKVLCDTIVDRYHGSLQENLSRIRDELASLSMAASSPALEMMRTAFAELADQIAQHLAKEENLLFPAIAALSSADRAGAPALVFVTVLHPIRRLEAEHVRIEAAVDRLRELARGVRVPDARLASWQQCKDDLARFDIELREHHRTENEVLFPRALELERRVL